MSVPSYNGYPARVEFDGEDRIFVGRIAVINDVVGIHGESVRELDDAFHEAVDDYLATCRKAGKSPVVGQFKNQHPHGRPTGRATPARGQAPADPSTPLPPR